MNNQTHTLISPTITSFNEATQVLHHNGYAVLGAQAVQAMCHQQDLSVLNHTWDDLPRDAYLRDGGHYRQRRHASFVCAQGVLQLAAHRAHYQPIQYNALHGGLQRLFEPINNEVVQHPAWQTLLTQAAHLCSQVKPNEQDTWYIEAHQFRIDTTDGIGRPTPEGAHRDGVDFVMVFLLSRVGIKGGETRVFDANGTHGERFTLSEPWSLLWMDDERVIHESTPIQPLSLGGYGYRDTLVLTFRRGGFLVG